jgi:inhibitor of cysteine peptidase
MKRIKSLPLILTLVLAMFLAACSAPTGITSPSLSNQTSGTSKLERASDYSALISLMIKAKANQTNYPYRMYDLAEKGASAPNASNQDSAQTGNTDYSHTNIQVEGVDEADIIKTDGQYLYIVGNNRLYVIDARDPAQMKVLSTQVYTLNQETEKYVYGESPMEIFLDTEHDRLILIVSGWLYEKIPQTTDTTAIETKPDDPTPVETKPTETITVDTKPADGTLPPDTTTLPPDAPTAGTDTSDPAATDVTSSDGSTGTGTASSGEGVTPASGVDVASKELVAPRIWNPYYTQKQYTTTRIYDLADKTAPKLVRQFTQTGYYVSSRKIDSAVYVVTNEYKYQVYAEDAEPKPADVFPATQDSTDPVSPDNWDTLPPETITILPSGDVSNQTVLSAIDIANDDSKPDLLAVLGSSGMVYSSTNYLYVAAYNYQWDGKEGTNPVYSTDLFRFKLAGAQISEAGKGNVPGTVLNQYSMDEYNGYFRIATTTYEWVQTKDSSTNANKNNVFVLDASMKVVGKITGLAEGESIKSVRFMGDQAYVVTFRDVDPLFVIDMADPTAPKVLGQLKIPGYSTYLHPYDAGKLIGFGYDVKTENGNAYNMGLKVSLFDISDFSNPVELSTILLGGRGSYADILYNPKTLLFSREKNLIAFPATLFKSITDNPLEYGQPVFQGMLILEVDENNQLKLRGSVTHFDKLSNPDGKPVTLTDEEAQAFYSYDVIYRGAWIGNNLYTFSARQIRAFDLNSLAPLGEVELPGYKDNQNYYYRGVVGIAEPGVKTAMVD